ncbi:hypothetical protein [Actimicrobium antarcticum]|uniref:Uncharacterized protein n=1 Tax=Actimicrobium antarcticum TaxID=1051899 RepID=A0ABP7SQX8_9BURK
MTAIKQAVALVDKRPFFEKALSHGVRKGTIDMARCNAMITDGAKGTVQVAAHFGTSSLQSELDNARTRIVNLVSLYLEDSSGGDLDKAAQSLQDNTFLFHSRSGNEMLKKLFAMQAMADGVGMDSQSLLEFQQYRTLKNPYSLAAYRREFKLRQDAIALIAAAHWFCDDLHISRATVDPVAVDAVIRSAILMRHAGTKKVLGRAEFERVIDAIRSRPPADGKLKIAKAILDDVPEPHHAIAEKIRRDIIRMDGPVMLSPTLALHDVLNRLKDRYHLEDVFLEDLDSFAAFASKEWTSLTKGKDDPFSQKTLFMCLATAAKPKIAITQAEARTMIRQVRKNGLDSAAVIDFIHATAPHEMQESLLMYWDEFLPEAEECILDDADISLQRAMMFLADNLNVKAKAKAKSAT